MKKNNYKNIIELCLLVVLVALAYSLPQFYFNEFEFGFRKNFAQAYLAMDEAERGIGLRQRGSEEIDDELFSNLGEAIEDELKNALSFLDEADLYTQRQEQILFLLPKKYKEYIKLKQQGFSAHYQLVNDFRLRKKNEHLTTETAMLIVQINQSVRNTKNGDQWLYGLEQIPSKGAQIRSNANVLLEKNHITQEYYDYLIKTVDSYNYLFNLYAKVLESNSWVGIDYSGLGEFITPAAELDTIMENLKAEWDASWQAHFDKVEENNHELLIASNYFNEQQIARDPISKLLSLFSDAFPRIKTIENREPTIVPDGVIVDLLSYARGV